MIGNERLILVATAQNAFSHCLTPMAQFGFGDVPSELGSGNDRLNDDERIATGLFGSRKCLAQTNSLLHSG